MPKKIEIEYGLARFLKTRDTERASIPDSYWDFFISHFSVKTLLTPEECRTLQSEIRTLERRRDFISNRHEGSSIHTRIQAATQKLEGSLIYDETLAAREAKITTDEYAHLLEIHHNNLVSFISDLLTDYADNWLHWGRHHRAEARVLRTAVQSNGILLFNLGFPQLEKHINDAKSKDGVNPKGSFNRRLEFIASVISLSKELYSMPIMPLSPRSTDDRGRRDSALSTLDFN